MAVVITPDYTGTKSNQKPKPASTATTGAKKKPARKAKK